MDTSGVIYHLLLSRFECGVYYFIMKVEDLKVGVKVKILDNNRASINLNEIYIIKNISEAKDTIGIMFDRNNTGYDYNWGFDMNQLDIYFKIITIEDEFNEALNKLEQQYENKEI